MVPDLRVVVPVSIIPIAISSAAVTILVSISTVVSLTILVFVVFISNMLPACVLAVSHLSAIVAVLFPFEVFFRSS